MTLREREQELEEKLKQLVEQRPVLGFMVVFANYLEVQKEIGQEKFFQDATEDVTRTQTIRAIEASKCWGGTIRLMERLLDKDTKEWFQNARRRDAAAGG